MFISLSAVSCVSHMTGSEGCGGDQVTHLRTVPDESGANVGLLML